MEVVDEKTKFQRGEAYGDGREWFDITTEIISRSASEGIDVYNVRTHPTTRGEEYSPAPKHYAVEVGINNATCWSKQIFDNESFDPAPSIKLTLEAMAEHFETVRIIRESGAIGLWNRNAVHEGIYSAP